MEYHVSGLSIACMAIGAVMGTVIPIVLFLYLRKKKNASGKAFLCGWLAFFAAALLLERGFHALVFSTPVGAWIQNNLFFYALYGGLMAGLFEELARYFCFSKFLKPEMNNDWNALMYGAGHGGCEMFNIFAVTMVGNLTYALTLNSQGITAFTNGLSGEALEQMTSIITELCTVSPGLFLFGLLERVSAIILQLALSVLVFYAAKNAGEDRKLLLIAVELHALVDFLAVILNALVPVAVVELVVLLLSLGAAYFARMVWRRHQEAA
ncbi:MAG: YhfC family intramembrane metalloprotease [Solobacterium sp.]|nr:YhfC family intramembrane metalloprotease [Solobacterium sp.]